MKNKRLMKLLSAFLAVVIVLCSAPLSGLVGLKLPDWFSLKADAETEDELPDNAVDYSGLTVNQYMSKILLNHDYVGAANGWDPTSEPVPKGQLDFYLDINTASSSKILVDAAMLNNDFLSAVASWEFLTFDPSNIVDDLLDEKGYYTAVIYSILDVLMKDSDYLEAVDNVFGNFAMDTYSISMDIAGTFTDIDLNNLNANLSDTTKTNYINDLVDKTILESEKSFIDYFGKGVSFVKDSLKVANTVNDINQMLTSYMMLSHFGETVGSVLYEMYENCDSSNVPLKAALLETYEVCTDDMKMATIGVINTGVEVLNFAFSEIVGSLWKECISGIAGGFVGGLLIGQAIGTAISNFCFSTEPLIEQFYALRACYQVENLMIKTVNSLGSKFKNNQSKENANNYIKSIEFLFSSLNLGSDYALKFAEIVHGKGWFNQLKSCWGEDQTLEFYRDTVPSIKNSRNLVKEFLTNIEGFIYCFELDAPSSYKQLFENSSTTSSSPVYSKNVEPVYIEPQVFPEKKSAVVFTYKLKKDKTITITGCHPSSYGAIEVPAEIDGYPVETIENYVFKGLKEITSVKLLGNVKKIGTGCFDNCENLLEVELNVGLNEIGYAAFKGTSIMSIRVPKTVKTLCSYMDRVYESAFFGADQLKTVDFEYGMLKIPDYALCDCSSVTDVIIPEGVIEIGRYAFANCTGLKDVIIPNSVIKISYAAFSDCKGLASFNIPDSVVSIEAYAFYGCTEIKSIEIPGNVKEMGERVFSCCTNLMTVELNEGLEAIGFETFAGTSITSISIPKTVNSLCSYTYPGYESAFSGAEQLKTVVFEEGIQRIPDYAFFECSSIASVIMPDGVNEIGRAAFAYCIGLTKISIPSSVTTICSYAFRHCTGLTQIDIPNSVTTIHEYAFGECSQITSIEIPESVKEIGESVFAFCTNLKKVELNEGLEKIAYRVFDGTSITSISIPKTVNSLCSYTYPGYESAFSGAEQLKTVVFQNGMQGIPAYALYDCSSVTSVVIPDGVTGIGINAFKYCTGLARITIPSSVTQIYSEAFVGCSNLTIYAVKNTTGYNYAIENNINVIEIACPHTNTETIVDSRESCTVDGVSRVICSLCKETLSTETIKASGHDFASEYVIYNATCTESGLKQGICSKCGDVEDITIEPLGHTLGEFVETKAPTETEKGENRAKCIRCNYYETKEIPPTSHIHGEWIEKTSPTCTEKGEEIFYCSECDELIETREIPALGHEYDIWETNFEPTCTTPGEVMYTCSRCGDSYSEEISATGPMPSDPVKENYVEATCTESGSYDVVVYCTACGEELSRETKSIPVTGHSFGAWEVTTEPSMTEDGVKTRTCSSCGETEEGIVPKTGVTVYVMDSEYEILNMEVIAGDSTEYSLADLEDGEYIVMVEKETYAIREYQITATNGELSFEFKLNHVGDINGDGRVNTMDVARANASAKGVTALTGYDFECADINGDGRVNTMDVARMNAHAKGVTTLW